MMISIRAVKLKMICKSKQLFLTFIIFLFLLWVKKGRVKLLIIK